MTFHELWQQSEIQLELPRFHGKALQNSPKLQCSNHSEILKTQFNVNVHIFIKLFL